MILETKEVFFRAHVHSLGRRSRILDYTLVMFFCLRTTMPLVSYIRNSLRFWYYASLSTCCQNLETKLGSPGKFGRKRGVKLLRDLTEKSVNFGTLATSNIRLLLVFGEEDQINKRN